LNQKRTNGRRPQVTKDFVELKAVSGAQRQDDRVFGCRGLQLKIELTAETLSERESPRPVQPAAKRRVNHELLTPALVKEPLDHPRLPRRHRSERDPGCG